MNKPRVVITFNNAGKMVMSSNVSLPRTKSMMVFILNEIVQAECKKQIEQESKIIKPSGFRIGGN